MIAYLSKIEAKKSTGHDGLSPKILKLSTPSLVDPLTTLFNSDKHPAQQLENE